MPKRSNEDPIESNTKLQKREDCSGSGDTSNCLVLQDIRLHIIPTGMGRIRYNLFLKQTSALGGIVEDKITPLTSYIIVDESVSLQKVYRILNWKEPPIGTKIIKSLWLSKCIENKSLHPTADYELIAEQCAISSKQLIDEQCTTSNRQFIAEQCIMVNRQCFNKTVSDSYSSTSTNSDLLQSSEPCPVKGFVCSMPSSQNRTNYNKHITDKLELLLETYKCTGDQWRTYGYEKAIIALKSHPKEITTREEAKSLKGVGDRLADKIVEIIQSGNLRKVEEVCFEKRNFALSLFTKVWGIGSITAQALVQKGFYTLEDLSRAKLTHAQQIGLKYFEELQERMPRTEAAEIFDLVMKNVKAHFPSVHAVACGSYRRNKDTCGDVDVLVTDFNGPLPSNILPNIVRILHDIGFLTDNLVSEEENGSQKKYMGICKLIGENKKHRRIDIIAVPQEEYACALMHFTGSAHFNRSIRLLAAKKNMSLSEHNLRAGIIRQGKEKTTDGYILPTPTEESIFTHLGLEYRPPYERDH